MQILYKPHEADWSRDLRGNSLITTVSLKEVLVVSTYRDKTTAKEFMRTLAEVGPPMGIQVTDNFHLVTVDNDRTDNFLHTIRSNVQEDTQLVWSCGVSNQLHNREMVCFSTQDVAIYI